MLIPQTVNRIALIIRHAERYEISRMSNALEALLTEKGKNDAFNLGVDISHYSPISIYFSPVKRCEETSDNILQGIRSQNRVSNIEGSIFNLGGPYIRGDWRDVAAMVEKMGQSIFVRKWFNNEFPVSLIAPLEESARLQSSILVDQLLTGDGSFLNVTHDWNIMILREYYFNQKHEETGQPAFLDGLWASMQDDSIILSSLGSSIVLPIDTFIQTHNQKSRN